MELVAKEIKASYINGTEWYSITRCMGSLTLFYGEPDKKSKKYNGIAFKDYETAIEVAKNLLEIAEALKLVEKEK